MIWPKNTVLFLITRHPALALQGPKSIARGIAPGKSATNEIDPERVALEEPQIAVPSLAQPANCDAFAVAGAPGYRLNPRPLRTSKSVPIETSSQQYPSSASSFLNTVKNGAVASCELTTHGSHMPMYPNRISHFDGTCSNQYLPHESGYGTEAIRLQAVLGSKLVNCEINEADARRQEITHA